MKLSLIAALVKLYPASYRAEFGKEMIDVSSRVLRDARRSGNLAWVTASLRELTGLAGGCMREHLREQLGGSWVQIATRRFSMRSEFRYPKATIPMMALIFACIVLIIYKARAVQVSMNLPSYDLGAPHYMLAVTLGIAFAVACMVGSAGWLVLHSLHRSGVHRLSEAQTWPEAK